MITHTQTVKIENHPVYVHFYDGNALLGIGIYHSDDNIRLDYWLGMCLAMPSVEAWKVKIGELARAFTQNPAEQKGRKVFTA
jgi:hypothetical protein